MHHAGRRRCLLGSCERVRGGGPAPRASVARSGRPRRGSGAAIGARHRHRHRAEVQTLAARYGARITEAVRGGAVLEVTGGQLDALSQDPDVAHLSGDVPVRRMMAVTNEATGATRCGAGLAGSRASPAAASASRSSTRAWRRTGRSAGRVVASLDFTDAQGRGASIATATARTSRASSRAATTAATPASRPGAHIVSLRVLGRGRRRGTRAT